MPILRRGRFQLPNRLFVLMVVDILCSMKFAAWQELKLLLKVARSLAIVGSL